MVAFIIFMAGCAVGCGTKYLYPRRPDRQQQLPAALGGDGVDKATMTETWEEQDFGIGKESRPNLSSGRQNGGVVFHLPEKDRVVHFNRNCRHLVGANDVEKRLVIRSVCLTCSDSEAKKKV